MFLLNGDGKVRLESHRKQVVPPHVGLCEFELDLLLTKDVDDRGKVEEETFLYRSRIAIPK